MDKEVKPGSAPLFGLRTWTAARWREYGFRLVLELIVVFVGVYAASAFGRYQEKREADTRRHQVRQALLREVEGIIANTRNAASQVRQGLAAYQEAARQKQFLPPDPFLEPVRFQTHMWEATLQSDGLDLLDVSTVYKLSEFYNQLNEGFAQLQQLRDLSERMLLPLAGAPPAEYYDLQTDRVRPRYAWYFEGMQRLARLAEDITLQGERLIEEMQAQDGATPTIKISGVRADLTLLHLVAPEYFKDRLPPGTRAIALRDGDLDSAQTAITTANPALLDHAYAILRIVDADSVRVNQRMARGSYALWWLLANDTSNGERRRVYVPLDEWFTDSLASGPLREADRQVATAQIQFGATVDRGGLTIRMTAPNLQLTGSCLPSGPGAPGVNSDAVIVGRRERLSYSQSGGVRQACSATWELTGTHPMAAALRALFNGPGATFQTNAIAQGWRARIFPAANQ